MISTKNTNAEATKLVVESISNNRGLNTLTCMNEYKSKLTITNVLSRHVQLLSANDGVPEVGGLDPLLDMLELHPLLDMLELHPRLRQRVRSSGN